jgi:Ni/Fe-hydrogenase subunit HybB-like protein
VYVPSLVELSIVLGSFALFTTLFLLFVKIFPSVSIYEVKETMDTPKVAADPGPVAPAEGSPA